jgi:hypothetical protein
VKRREFITLLGGAAAAWPFAAGAQQGERMRRIGVLAGGAVATDADTQERNAAFAKSLQELGWVIGRNVQIDFRYGVGNAANVRKYAEELVALLMLCWFPALQPWRHCCRRHAQSRLFSWLSPTQSARGSWRAWRARAAMPLVSSSSNTL